LEDPPAAPRTGFDIIGTLLVVVLVVAVVAFSLRGGDQPDVNVEPAAAAAAASQPDLSCAARLPSIMDAVIAYQAAHGAPPESLSALYPEFLPFAPGAGDAPASYGYRVLGETISLSCPHPETASATH
jgi:hypothetical protein